MSNTTKKPVSDAQEPAVAPGSVGEGVDTPRPEKPVKGTSKTNAAKDAEPEYSIRELAAAAPRLVPGATPDCVTAALRLAGLKTASRSKAAELVAEFIKKEVN